MGNDAPIHTDDTFKFNFERNFENQEAEKWIMEHWTDSIFYSAIYLSIIFGLKHVMEKRSGLNLNRMLFVWNLFLAIFSVIATYRTVPEFFNILTNKGYYESVCSNSFVASNKVTGSWTFLFAISKVLELVDTLFLVLRKRPLTLLHVYHHVIAVIYTWFSYKEFTATIRWFMVMNLIVHSIMYTYYALSAMTYKPPKPIAMLITLLQIIQMIVGFIVNISAYVFRTSSYNCHISRTNFIFSLIMYGSFIILFIRFFMKTYIPDKQSTKIVEIPKKFE